MPLNYVKSLKGPFEQGDYVAIGGVSPENFKEFLAAGYLDRPKVTRMQCSGQPFFLRTGKEAAAKRDWNACAAAVLKITEGLKKERCL